MPQDVAAVVLWCRQAERQGLLRGDICRCRQIAAAIVEKYKKSAERHDSLQWSEKIDDMFETWMMLRFPKAYEVLQKDRAESSDLIDQRLVDEHGYIQSDSMAEMISKIRAGGF